MQTSHRITAAFIPVLLIAVTGCAGTKSPLAFFKRSSSGTASAGSSAPTPPSLAGQGLGQPRPPAETGFANSVSNTFKSMGDTVSSAFKPKVTPASDPVSLSSSPDKVGVEVFVAAAARYESLQMFDEAKLQYEKALQVAPKNRAALVGLARLHDRRGDFDEAVAYYTKAVAAYPDNAEIHNDLGLCLARQSKIRESIAALGRAVELDPKKVLYRNNVATVLIEAGRADDALRHLNAVHQPAIAHYNLGYLLYNGGQTQLAATHFTLAAEKDPSLKQAHQMLAKLGRPGVQVAAQRPGSGSAYPQTPVYSETPISVYPVSQRPDDEFVIRRPQTVSSPSDREAAAPPMPSDSGVGFSLRDE